MEKFKRWVDSCRDTCFCCLLGDDFHIMYLGSFNFNLSEVEAESIISKQFSVLSALQVSLLTRCVKM